MLPFAKTLFALGIRHVGESTARTLASSFSSIDDLIKSDLDHLMGLPDIGPKVAHGIISFFENQENLNEITKLRDLGLQFKSSSTSNVNLPLKGTTFVITGSFSNFSRKELTEKVVSKGGKVSASVSKNTSYVLVGENPGSKFDKANQLGIQILDIKSFLQLIDK